MRTLNSPLLLLPAVLFGQFLSGSTLSLGDPCENLEECALSISNSNCSAPLPGQVKRCRCASHHVQLDEFNCIPASIFVGDSCEFDVQCSNLVNTYCEPATKTCNCSNADHVHDNYYGAGCYPKVYSLGTPCKSVTQCQVKGSRCGEKSPPEEGATCQCYTNSHVKAPFRNTCLPLALTFESRCEEDIQCTAGNPGQFSECREGICFCKPPYVQDRYSCKRPRLLGLPCEEEVDTCVDISGSSSSVSCRHYYNGLYSIDTCQCIGEMKAIDGRCHNTRWVGRECSTHGACKIGISGPTFCDRRTGTCACDSGYTGVASNCIQSAVGYGGECSSINSVHGCKNIPGDDEGQVCTMGRCRCATNYTLNHKGYCSSDFKV